MSQPREIITCLIKQDVGTVRAWLDAVWKGQTQIPEDFSWPNLAAALNVLARSGNGPKYYEQPHLEWGRVAVSVYLYAISQVDLTKRKVLEESMMYLKGHLIAFYGNVAGDPVLDINQIIAWFFKHLHHSIEEVETKLTHRQALGIEEAALLRDINTRLSLLRFLANRGLFSPNDELKRWFELQSRFP